MTAEMLRYELINPSDRYTLTANSHEVACIAAALLGEGAYGLEPLEGTPGEGMPIFLLSSGLRWFQKTFGRPLEDMLAAMDRAAVADALESVAASLDEKHRGSLNNIGGRAAAMARALRKPKVTGEPK